VYDGHAAAPQLADDFVAADLPHDYAMTFACPGDATISVPGGIELVMP
jgi:hypothetical protein